MCVAGHRRRAHLWFMRIAILGPGAIGSTFAFQLARAGHDVTVIARGARLEFLQREQAIVLQNGERAKVSVAPSLDEKGEWDLVLVTVLATQVAPVLPSLKASAAKRVMFMFNTFESIDPLRDAVGAERFTFGFPGGVFSLLIDGKINPTIRSGTTVGDPAIAKTFTDAGIPTVVEPDMQSWLRTHAAMVVPLMSIGVTVHARGSGVTWKEAGAYARAFDVGMQMTRSLGNTLLPSSIASMAKLPMFLMTFMLWAMSRSTMLRDLGALGAAEPRMLIDMMSAASPQLAAPLLAIKP
jgi:2-dehydropantoate 2-reductase